MNAETSDFNRVPTQKHMNEEYELTEISDVTPEMNSIPETNPETSVPEHHSYGVREDRGIEEFQDYSAVPKKKSTRHAALMKSNRTRLGRLLSAVTTVVAPAVAIVLIVSGAILVDVIRYEAGSDFLRFDFKLSSNDPEVSFTAVLSELSGPDHREIEAREIDPEYPSAEFFGLEPGREYLLEVWAAGEVRLSLTYITSGGEHGGTVYREEDLIAGYNRLDIAVRAEGTVPENLFAFIGDREAEVVIDGDLIRIKADNLEPETTYSYVLKDGDGNVLCEGIAETPARAHASIEVSEYLPALNSLSLAFRVDKPDGNEITAEFDGAEFVPETTDGVIRLEYTNLEEGSKHYIVFRDYDGSVIGEFDFETRSREGAVIELREQEISFDSVRLVYSVYNPDSNAITLKYDGVTVDADLSGSTFILERTGLTMGENHTVEFIDIDGSVILSHSFSAKLRTQASVELTEADGRYDSIFGASSNEFKSFCIRATYRYSNPDGNSIKVTVNGQEATAYYSDGTAVLPVDNLEPSTDYEIVFTDYDGTVLLTHTVRTPDRLPVSVDILNSLIKLESISYSFLFDNPHENRISFICSEQSINAGAHISASTVSATNGNITLSGLKPDTSYSFVIHDDSLDTDIRTVVFTTPRAFTVTQNAQGDAVITLTDAFKEAYSSATVTVTDSLGTRIPVTASQNATVFTAAAADLIYADRYTVAVSAGGKTVSSAVSQLSGRTRPSFSLRHEASSPATLAEAAESGSSSVGESGFFIKYTGTGYYPEPSMSDGGQELSFYALVIRNSSGKAVTCAIDGFTDANFLNQNPDEERLWMEMSDAAMAAGTYRAGVYLMSGHTREELETMLWGEGQMPQFDKVGELFIKDGRLLSDTSFRVNSSKTYSYGYFYTDAVSSGPATGTVAFTPTVVYYSDNTGYTGYLTVVKASSPTVHAITPISLGTQTDYTELNPITLNFNEPFYVIVYQNSFTPSEYISVTYITP
ncbi:MAG: hypothetical protein MJ137_00495 [Clostridia bacterium]|nr:hypothetical protein [Clostridia bacterium]